MKVLVVDDEKGIRDMLQEVVSQEGYEVETASDGSEALKVVQDKNIEIALVDLRMPGMDGIRLIEAVREYQTDQQNKEIPIVILTAYNDEPVKQSAERLGVKQMMFKPFEPQALQEAIELILAG